MTYSVKKLIGELTKEKYDVKGVEVYLDDLPLTGIRLDLYDRKLFLSTSAMALPDSDTPEDAE